MANDYKTFAKDYRTAFEEAKRFSLRGVFLPKDLPLRPPRYREHSEDFDNLRNDVQSVCKGINKAFEEARDKLEH